MLWVTLYLLLDNQTGTKGFCTASVVLPFSGKALKTGEANRHPMPLMQRCDVLTVALGFFQQVLQFLAYQQTCDLKSISR